MSRVGIPNHGVYVGGLGTALGTINLGEYVTVFDGTDDQPVQSRVGSSMGEWLSNPTTWEAKLRMPWDDHGIGITCRLNFHNILLADARVNDGDMDAYLNAIGDLLATMRSEGCPIINLTPFGETVGIHTLGGAITLGDGTEYRNAFTRCVTMIRARVEIDHVAWHFNSTDGTLINEYAPSADVWDSYGLTIDRESQLPNVDTAWAHISSVFPHAVMCMPEWKSADIAVTLESAWAQVQNFFDNYVGIIPIHFTCWSNKDPADDTWGYPEMRFQLAHANNIAALKAAWDGTNSMIAGYYKINRHGPKFRVWKSTDVGVNYSRVVSRLDPVSHRKALQVISELSSSDGLTLTSDPYEGITRVRPMYEEIYVAEVA